MKKPMSNSSVMPMPPCICTPSLTASFAVLVARALAMDPDILFLDEPTSGLDPIGAGQFDDLIHDLSRTLGLTVVMITHDLDSLHSICDRVAVLAEKRVIANAPVDEVAHIDHPWIQEYFGGPRGRAVLRET